MNPYSKIIRAYLDLTKPRILSMVLVTAALGFILAKKEIDWHVLMGLLSGVALVCAGAGVLNNYLEREVDSKMLRTRQRPLPAGIISAPRALNFGILLILGGVSLLWGQVNLLTAFLGLLSAFLYVLVYTPMKRMTWLNTSIGAIPGALPPVGGWAAATGEVSLGAWVLFFILFFWQHPHFYAIAWMYKEDYERGGFKMLPVVEPDGQRTFQHIIVHLLVLIPVSLLPSYLGMSGQVYFWGTLVGGIGMLIVAWMFTSSGTFINAKRLLKASVIYLPVLLILIILDVKI